MDFYVADGHCDFLYGMTQYGYEIDRQKDHQTIYIDALKRGNVGIQFFAAWTDMGLKRAPLSQCMTMMDAYDRILENHPEFVPLTEDFEPGKGEIATVLTIEGGEAVDGNCAVLRELKRCGLSAMTLTWNDNNELAGAALARGNKGLTSLGKEIIDEMIYSGIAIDVSHLSDRGIEDIFNHTDEPVFASHSNARKVCDSKRSLPDEFIKEIARRGGTIGINFYPPQLTGSQNADLSDIVRQFCYVAEIGGIDCCAIGSDFDGMTRYPKGMKSPADFPALAKALLKGGFSESDLKKVFYDNLRNFIIQYV